jgi:tight adherence protein B
MTGPLIFGIFVATAVMVLFFALGRYLDREDPIAARIKEYGLDDGIPGRSENGGDGPKHKWTGVNRLLKGAGLSKGLAAKLSRADVPMTVAEFTVLVAIIAAVGFGLGTFFAGPLMGLAGASLISYLSLSYLKTREGKRKRAFGQQLPDVLTLLVSGLRAGYGLSQALEMIVQQAPKPSSTEFGRVMRGMSLGLSIQASMEELSKRIDSDDLFLVVTAVTVQHELGGNLAQTLDTIGETIRDRIRIKREIATFTSQQRFTGYALAVFPLLIAVALFVINREYMMQLFEPGWIRIVPVVTVLMEVLGFLVMRAIINIEV